MNKKNKTQLSRRKFLGTGLLGAAGIGVVPQIGIAKEAVATL
jgi:hypothetical protein